MDKCMDIILILGKYLLDIFGYHFLREVIYLIVLTYKNCTKLKISCGYNHTTLIKDDIYVWGSNGSGQLGLGHTNGMGIPQKIMMDNIKKIKCGLLHTIILRIHGEIYEYGNNKSTFQQITSIEKIKKIDCGYYHTLVLTMKNEVYVQGNNSYGQLGLGDYNRRDDPQKLNLTDIELPDSFESSVHRNTVETIHCGSNYTMVRSKYDIFVWAIIDMVS